MSTPQPHATASPVAFSKEMNIHQRINGVRQRIEYLKKEKKVEGYKAVTHDQVTDALRDSLIEFGILVAPSMVPGTSRVEPTGTFTAKKVPFIRFEVECAVAFINIDSPTDREILWITAHALDHGDKAPGKAISYATKAAELKMFNIVTGEEDEERPLQEGGMNPRDEGTWKGEIDKLAQLEEIDPLWELIVTACQNVGDREAYVRLRGYMSAKKQALEKALAPKPAAKKAA